MSWLRNVFGSADVLGRPAAAWQGDRVPGIDRADERPCTPLLELQDCVLAAAFACWTKVWLPTDPVRIWFWGKYERSTSNVGEFVFGKPLFFLQRSYKLRFGVSETLRKRRVLVQKCLLRRLNAQYGVLRFDDMREQRGGGEAHFVGVALGNQAFGEGLDACDGGEGHLKFIKHGCPSGKTVRVEELAVSSGEGSRPNEAGEVAHG